MGSRGALSEAASAKHVGRTLCASVLALLLGLTVAVTAAHAATAHGNWRSYGPVNGWSYEHRAHITVPFPSGGIVAATTGGNAPTGYIGINPRSYTASGQLCAFGSWAYNDGPASRYGGSSGFTNCGRGNYYGQGLTRAYNGNGYNTYTTLRSPQLTW